MVYRQFFKILEHSAITTYFLEDASKSPSVNQKEYCRSERQCWYREQSVSTNAAERDEYNESSAAHNHLCLVCCANRSKVTQTSRTIDLFEYSYGGVHNEKLTETTGITRNKIECGTQRDIPSM